MRETSDLWVPKLIATICGPIIIGMILGAYFDIPTMDGTLLAKAIAMIVGPCVIGMIAIAYFGMVALFWGIGPFADH